MMWLGGSPTEPRIGSTKSIGAPPPTSAVHLLQQLNIVENFDLAKMGYHSADALHVLIEATKAGGRG